MCQELLCEMRVQRGEDPRVVVSIIKEMDPSFQIIHVAGGEKHGAYHRW